MTRSPDHQRARADTDAMPFLKMHGLGNDFVVLDLRGMPRDQRVRPFTREATIAIADRRRGVGCDQLIGLEPPRNPAADIFMRIANADGDEVSACGNASRCVAQLLFDELGRDTVTVETQAGLLSAKRRADNLISVDMGPARLDWREIPLAHEADTNDLPVAAGALSSGVGVNMGNPHAVFFVEDAAGIDLETVGPQLEHDPLFPERANISAAQILSTDHIRLRVWERGVGITQACGTAACATVVAAARRGLGARTAIVSLDGGDLEIEWRADNHVEMTGPATLSFTGALPADLFGAG